MVQWKVLIGALSVTLGVVGVLRFPHIFRIIHSLQGNDGHEDRSGSFNTRTSAVDTDALCTTPPPRFVLLIGLEGTGHHLHKALVTKSPTFQQLNESQALPVLQQLQLSLFNIQNMGNSLWGLACAGQRGAGGGKANVFQNVVSMLRKVDTAVPADLTIPINGALTTKGFGMVSYPNFLGNCVPLQYPDVGPLYDACDQANVTCQHVVISRDAYSVIRSTTIRRKYHTTPYGIELYTTLLGVIYKQITEFPNRTAACWTFEDFDDAWKIGHLYGWKSKADFDEFYSELYEPPQKPNRSIIPKNMEAHMRSMIRATNLMAEKCANVELWRKCNH